MEVVDILFAYNLVKPYLKPLNPKIIYKKDKEQYVNNFYNQML